MKKRVAVICGSSVATARIVVMKLRPILEQRGIDADLFMGGVSEAGRMARTSDLIVYTTPVPADVGIPVVNGVPFLTGIGEKDTVEEIVRILTAGEE